MLTHSNERTLSTLEYDSITQDLLSALRKGPLKSPSILDGRQK
ncbi:hypothetical protein VCHA50P416_280013 [Vibrio chagasii]|nr:hypothetical protein VCHA42P256_270014 [Vibrio chagasii]CAH7125834.1 hypothetical protein VCHA52P454_260013 [Vibrio chagasii]CAH7141968.1 hypothetical protein VCHA43P272_290034 [Vibrio chagasii]CAH7330956.1 hypothetical protein VCHA50P416_280013 [Vibrio chagasii]